MQTRLFGLALIALSFTASSQAMALNPQPLPPSGAGVRQAQPYSTSRFNHWRGQFRPQLPRTSLPGRNVRGVIR